jgi:hypothetical protein
LFSN